MVKFCTDTLVIPDTAKVVTRRFFAQRVALRFEDAATANTFYDAFRSTAHKVDGTRLYIQRDLPPQQRKMA
eukprot:2995556-Amphidinium_carterae.1